MDHEDGGRLASAIAAATGPAKSALAMILSAERQIRRDHRSWPWIKPPSQAAPLSRQGTWALLNELLAAGYSKTFLAKLLGKPRQNTASRIPETDLKGAEECSK